MPSLRSLLGNVRAFARKRASVLVVAGLLLGVVLVFRGGPTEGATLEEALGRALRREEGIALEAGSILFLEDDPGPLAGRACLFVAHREGELPDLYFGEVRATGTTVLGLAFVTNLTRTSSAAEEPPRRLGDHAIYASKVSGRYDAVVMLDLRGEPKALTADWPLRARLQNALSNLQETGRMRGFGRRRYTLEPGSERLEITLEDARFVVTLDDARVILDPDHEAPLEGEERVEVRPFEKGQPGTITWLVDTVRNLSFVGPEPIAWLEHKVYGVKDFLERHWYATRGSGDTEAEVAEALGVTIDEGLRRISLTETDPETGWPPAALAPILSPAVRGEGEWIPIVDDPFVATYPNAPPAFYQTFLRVDPERLYVRVYAIVWDPRQLQLRIVAGTREPESATGETGTGQIPRQPEIMQRVVAAMNGGFQALHGEFGMMSDGRVYLPPKPWAATIAVMDDGQVAMGSWLAPPPKTQEYEESWAVAQIPPNMVEYRQNLTSVVEDGAYNPWKRWYWGAAPLKQGDATFIDRSGLCLTKEGFLAYFWGQSMGPEQLGEAMIAARCVRGLHLDMNAPHTGFEFYSVRRASDPHPPLDRPLTEAEYEGPVPDAPEYVVRTRKAIATMQPMRFPRYIGRDPRDFFYLVQRPLLPGPDLDVPRASEAEGRFSTRGLPHAGFPHAFARAYLGPAAKPTWVVRVDPRRVRFDASGAATENADLPASRPLAYVTDAASRLESRETTLYLEKLRVGHRAAIGAPPPGATTILAGPSLARMPDARAAIGVDPDGFLVYVEQHDSDATRLPERLRQARVTEAVALPEGVRLAFVVDGQTVAPDAYERPVDRETSLPIVAHETKDADLLFPEVKPRPYGVWARLQDSRVRYFKTDKPARFTKPETDDR